MIIFVHGTGAAARDLKNPHWWQPISRFTRQLLEAIGDPVCVGKPQRWTGFNLESSRRHAGAALLKRLRRLDQLRIEYHLVGHSHGGSVIWHSLVGSVRTGQKLAGLRSWVTVGAPFLTFAPDPTAWWRYIGLLIAGTGIAWVSGQTIEGWQELSSIIRDAADTSLKAELYVFLTIALFVALVSRATYMLVQVSRHVYDLLRRLVLRAAEERAAAWYGARWLALWHERDEAIAGLRASLVDPLQVLPRWTKTAASRVKRLAFYFHDHGFARAVDQFVWAVGMGRVQGADIFDQRMVQARHCPDALSPGWGPLPLSITSAMTASADSKAAAATAAFREKLSTAGDLARAEQVVASFGASITWQELIHTSYFEEEPIVKLIADHIADANREGDDSSVQLLTQWRRARPPGPEGRRTRRAPLLAFPINRAIASFLVTLLLTIAAFSSYEAAIAPYTQRFLVDQIAREVEMPEFASAPRTNWLGENLVRLIALGKVVDFRQVLDKFGDRDSKEQAYNRLARAFGRLFPNTQYFLTPNLLAHLDGGSTEMPPLMGVNLQKLARDDPVQTFVMATRRLGYSTYQIQSLVLSGLVDAKQNVDPHFIDEFLSNVESERKMQLSDVSRWEIDAKSKFPYDPSQARGEVQDRILKEQYSDSIAEAAADLFAIGQTAKGDRLLDIAFVWGDRKLHYCPKSPEHIKRAGTLGSVDAVTKLIVLCKNRAKNYLFEAAFAAYAVGRLEVAGELLDMTKPFLEDLRYSPHLWEAILLQIDRNKLSEAIELASAWIDRLARHPNEGVNGRVVELVTRFRGMVQTTQEDRERVETIAEAIIATAVAAFQKAIDDPLFDTPASPQLLTRELASIFMAFNRAPDARRLADQAAVKADLQTVPDTPNLLGTDIFRRNEERTKRARESLQAGLLYSIVGESTLAINRLGRALSLIENIWADDKYEIGCAVFVAVSSADPKLARLAINAAAGQAARNSEMRASMFGNLGYRAAMTNDFRRVAVLSQRAGDPVMTLYGYALILDRILLEARPDTYKNWGLADQKWQPPEVPCP